MDPIAFRKTCLDGGLKAFSSDVLLENGEMSSPQRKPLVEIAIGNGFALLWRRWSAEVEVQLRLAVVRCELDFLIQVAHKDLHVRPSFSQCGLQRLLPELVSKAELRPVVEQLNQRRWHAPEVELRLDLFVGDQARHRFEHPTRSQEAQEDFEGGGVAIDKQRRRLRCVVAALREVLVGELGREQRAGILLQSLLGCRDGLAPDAECQHV